MINKYNALQHIVFYFTKIKIEIITKKINSEFN